MITLKQRYYNFGPIIIADDQRMNIEAIKMNLAELGVTKDIICCCDGNEAIDTAKALINESLASHKGGSPIKPIPLMLLDYHMPYKNGDEVISCLKKLFFLYKDFLIEPKYVIVTEHHQPKFLQEDSC